MHQGQGGPCRIDHLAGVVVNVSHVETRRRMLAPATVIHLLVYQEVSSLPDSVAISILFSSTFKSLQCEECSVCVADTPGPEPTTIRLLGTMNELNRSTHGLGYIMRPIFGEVFVEQ